MADSDVFDDDDESFDEEPAPPAKGRNTALTLVLCFLNVPAALAFIFLLVLDFQKRQEWAYAGFRSELHKGGVPLAQENDAPSASRAAEPKVHLSSEHLKAIAAQRNVKLGGDSYKSINEVFESNIKDLSPEVLKDYFGDLGDEVGSLEEEIERLKKKVPEDIAKVARDTVAGAKDENAKRLLVRKVLLPLAYDVYQVEALAKMAKYSSGLALDALLEDAVQRRMIADILAPCEIVRPGDVKTFVIEKIAEVESGGEGKLAFKLTQLKDLLKRRFEGAIAEKFDPVVHQGQDWANESRTSIEKRRTIAFLLTSLAYLKKPDGSLLYPRGLERAQLVLGLTHFGTALQDLTTAFNKLEEKVTEAIHIDRQGFEVTVKDKLERSDGFIDLYGREINRIRDLTVQIRQAEERLKDLQDQRDRAKKIHEERTTHLQASTKKLLAARVETARQVEELRRLQKQLFDDQRELSEAAERNFALELEIRQKERELRAKKGIKTP